MKVVIKGTPNIEEIRRVAEEIAKEIYIRKREEMYENQRSERAKVWEVSCN